MHIHMQHADTENGTTGGTPGLTILNTTQNSLLFNHLRWHTGQISSWSSYKYGGTWAICCYEYTDGWDGAGND